MNPSSAGWIKKFKIDFDIEITEFYAISSDQFYYKSLTSGFLYGGSTSLLIDTANKANKFTREELTKINLLSALLYIGHINNGKRNSQENLTAIEHFYEAINKGKRGFLSRINFSKNIEYTIEQILSARIQESATTLKNNTSTLLTHALLFTDVIAFDLYLKSKNDISDIYAKLEHNIVHVCFLALTAKAKKSKYDNDILTLFELYATNIQPLEHRLQQTLSSLPSNLQNNLLFKTYVLDLSCLAIYDDGIEDESENKFLLTLSQFLKISEEKLDLHRQLLITFAQDHGVSLKLFKYNNPARQFYNQTAQTVKNLIVRNKYRLNQELVESKELLVLIGASTYRDLNTVEKHKVKEQLLDICKTIPSLAIFILPGGTLLLPLLIKFIPKMLPSAFDENRITLKKNDKD